MKRIVLGLTAIFILQIQFTKAQHSNVFEPSAVKTVHLSAEIPGLGSDYPYNYKVTCIYHPQGKPADKQYLDSIDMRQYSEVSKANKTGAATPNILNSWRGNVYNVGTPPDNTVAISNGGIIISCINSSVFYYNTKGEELGSTNFLKLSRDFFGQVSSDLFDPRVIYDQEADRFIMVVLNGNSDKKSEVLVLFSKSNTPLDGWNAYALKGDVASKGYWFDYPNIGVNKYSLFISGNLYNTNDFFSDNTIFSISKADGYAGKDLNYTNWNSLSDGNGSAFGIVPVQLGTQGSYTSDAYFVSAESGYANFIQLYVLDPTSGKLKGYSVTVPYYSVPDNSPQQNTGDVLNMGDTRIKSAILIDGNIHTVHTTTTINGYAAVAYHRISVASKTATTKIYYNEAQKHYLAYPAIAQAGTSSTDQSVIIAYTESGADIYPRLSMMHVDANMNAGNPQVVKDGLGYVDIAMDTIERWGDYITIANRFNNNTCWLFGCVGGANQKHDNYVFELSMDKFPSGTEQPLEAVNTSMYPNPAVENVTVVFELEKRQNVLIDLYDADGKRIAAITNHTYNPGTQQLYFETNNLSPGIYFLRITGENGLLANKKLVKN